MVLWVIPGLFGHEPWKPDEGYTIGLVKHAVDSGDFVVPRLGDTPFMEKPPIFFIATALLHHHVFLHSDVLPLHQTMALVASCFLALMFLFTWLAGREAGGPRAGYTALLGLMGTVGLLVRAHSAITDVALWCGMAAAVYGMLLAGRRFTAGAFWFGTGAGLTFMAKGFLGPAFIGVAALLLPLASPDKRRWSYLGFLALALLFSSPWLVIWPTALYRQSPDLFKIWLMDNNLGRFLGPAYGYPRLADTGNIWKYVLMFPWFTLPLWPAAIVAWLRRGKAGVKNVALSYPTLIVVVGMVLLSVADTRRDLYLIPLLMPLAVVAGQAAGGSVSRWPDRLLAGIPAAVFAAAAVVVWAVWGVWRLGLVSSVTDLVERRAPGVDGTVSWAWLALAVVITVFCLWLLCRSRFRREWHWVWAGGMALGWGVAMCLFLPVLEHSRSYQPVFAAMFQAVPEAKTAGMDSIDLGESQYAIMDYYFGVKPGIVSPGGEDAEYVVVKNLRGDSDYAPDDRWQKVWEGRRPGDEREVYRLYRKLPE